MSDLPKILIVDDNPMFLSDAPRLFEKGSPGFEIISAPDVVGAMDRLDDTQPIQNLRLIVCDGLEGDYIFLLEWSRRNQIPFILFSGTTEYVQQVNLAPEIWIQAVQKPDLGGLFRACGALKSGPNSGN